MKYSLHLIILTLSLTCISRARAQTMDDSPATLAGALTHRREQVRRNAFSALLEKAVAGEDISDARPELLRFANLKHQDRFEPEELFNDQAEALKVLVVIDEQIAGKLLARASLLAEASIALDKQDRSTAHKATTHVRSALSVMEYLRKPEHVQQAAELAEKLRPEQAPRRSGNERHRQAARRSPAIRCAVCEEFDSQRRTRPVGSPFSATPISGCFRPRYPLS